MMHWNMFNFKQALDACDKLNKKKIVQNKF